MKKLLNGKTNVWLSCRDSKSYQKSLKQGNETLRNANWMAEGSASSRSSTRPKKPSIPTLMLLPVEPTEHAAVSSVGPRVWNFPNPCFRRFLTSSEVFSFLWLILRMDLHEQQTERRHKAPRRKDGAWHQLLSCSRLVTAAHVVHLESSNTSERERIWQGNYSHCQALQGYCTGSLSCYTCGSSFFWGVFSVCDVIKNDRLGSISSISLVFSI